jgi:hypothetical protein
MPADTQPTAEGDLGRTPFAHLLVYALERRLTGALFLTEPSGAEHVIRLARGAPVKARPGDQYMLLGEMLVEAGALSKQTLDDALATKGLLGDVLLLAGCVERDLLERTAEQQFLRRLVRFFSLPPETQYRYFDGHVALLDYGGEPANVDPLHVLFAGIRQHGRVSTLMDGTLALLGDGPITLHPHAVLPRFGFDGPEAAVIEKLIAAPCAVAELEASSLIVPEVLQHLLYTLLITRQIDLGRGAQPLGADEVPRGGRTATLAKMQVRSIVHRMGAAAPDLPGDGERAPVARRRKDSLEITAVDVATVREPAASPTHAPGEVTATVPHNRPEISPSSAVSSSEAVPTPLVVPSIVAPVADTSDVAATEPRPAVGVPNPNASTVPSAHVLADAIATARAQPPATAIPAAPPAELFLLARDRFENKDVRAAVDLCAAACAAAPKDATFASFHAWARSGLPGADLKMLCVELDEIIAAAETHAQARYYRAMLRRRLGDDAGALRDLRRVVELEPEHADATRELAVADERARANAKDAKKGGLLNRLFRR